MVKISSNEITNLGKEARESVKEPLGYCFPASKKLASDIREKYELSENDCAVQEVRMGDSGTIRHYVVRLKAKHIEDINTSGRVLIDVTLDQYCDENKVNSREKEGVLVSLGPKSEFKQDVYIFRTGSESPYTSV